MACMQRPFPRGRNAVEFVEFGNWVRLSIAGLECQERRLLLRRAVPVNFSDDLENIGPDWPFIIPKEIKNSEFTHETTIVVVTAQAVVFHSAAITQNIQN